MFERRKLRKRIEALEINPNLDTVLDRHSFDGDYSSINARECSPLTREQLVKLLWDLIESSRSVRGYEHITWAIGGIPDTGEVKRIGRFGFWFGPAEFNKDKFWMSARLDSGPFRDFTTVDVNVIRVSPKEFRASVSKLGRLSDLNSRAWRSTETREFW